MKPTLVVMAAGMGSRYGGLKQIDPIGPAGEIVIDYSVFDALRAGFGKVVFVIRRDIEAPFREVVEPHVRGRIAFDYAFQELGAVPGGRRPPEGRTKPWGTGQAILCCREVVREPFAVINADDFYGRDAFLQLGAWLSSVDPASSRFALVGYNLANTLSEHGSVSRGICDIDANGRLQGVVERTKIARQGGAIVAETESGAQALADDTPVSMNMWGFTPALFPALGAMFEAFLATRGGELKSEFYIPGVVDSMIREGRATVEVLQTSATWLGMTYPEDKPLVRAGIAAKIVSGEYPSPLW